MRFDVRAVSGDAFAWVASFYDPLQKALGFGRVPRVLDDPSRHPARLSHATTSRRPSPAEAMIETLDWCETLGVRYVIADEAYQLLAAKASGPRSRLESIKSFRNDLRIRMVLIGTEDLRQERNRSPEFARLCLDVDLAQYGTGKRDQEGFHAMLADVQQRLPPGTPDLRSHAADLYAKTHGSFGILHDWVAEALCAALLEGQLDRFLSYMKETEPVNVAWPGMEAERAAAPRGRRPTAAPARPKQPNGQPLPIGRRAPTARDRTVSPEDVVAV